jgi:hypothetical protein
MGDNGDDDTPWDYVISQLVIKKKGVGRCLGDVWEIFPRDYNLRKHLGRF